MRTLCYLAISLLGCAYPMAQPAIAADGDLPEDASGLVFEFEVLQEKVLSEMPLDRLVTQYIGHLNGIQEKLQAEGNLSGALAVESEIKLAGSGAVTEPGKKDPPELISARSIYLKTREEMEQKTNARIAPLRAKLITALDSLKKEYTVKGRIEEAIAIKTYLDQLALNEPVVAVSTPQTPAEVDGDVDIKLQIDGRSYLYLRGDELWYDHRGGAWTRPGLHEGEHPTYINRTTEWMPVWNDKETERYDAKLGIPVGVDDLDLDIRISDGRAQVEVVQQPAKDNDYTIKLELLDANEDGKGFFGSDWVRFRLSWKS